jgi:hypothetical protein
MLNHNFINSFSAASTSNYYVGWPLWYRKWWCKCINCVHEASHKKFMKMNLWKLWDKISGLPNSWSFQNQSIIYSHLQMFPQLSKDSHTRSYFAETCWVHTGPKPLCPVGESDRRNILIQNSKLWGKTLSVDWKRKDRLFFGYNRLQDHHPYYYTGFKNNFLEGSVTTPVSNELIKKTACFIC